MTSQESRGPNGFQAAAPPPKTADRHLLERRMGKKVEESGWEGNAKLLNDPALGQLQFPAGVISRTVSPHSEKPPLTQASCPMRLVTARMTFHASMTSPTLACPTGL